MRDHGVEIRELRPGESSILDEFLYLAIFVPEGEAPPEREIIERPELRVYVRDFGKVPGDRCLVAEAEGVVVGAAWARIMDDYGHVDDDTPSLAIALRPECRGRGIGTALLAALLDALRRDGWARASLSVQRANPARRLYLRLGFEVLEERGEEDIMACNLT